MKIELKIDDVAEQVGPAPTLKVDALGIGTSAPVTGVSILGPGADPSGLAPNGALFASYAVNVVPAGVIPSLRLVQGGHGDNHTFIGSAGIFIATGDDALTTPENKGVLYGIAISMQPRVARNNVPFDDVAAIVIQNEGTHASFCECVYVGHNAAFGTAPEWGAAFGTDANAGIVLKATGYYANGIDFAVPGGAPAAGYASFTGAAFHLGNNIPAIAARNTADTGDIEVVRVDTADHVKIAPGGNPMVVGGTLGLTEITGPPTPPAGVTWLYIRSSDHAPMFMGSDGVPRAIVTVPPYPSSG